MLFIKLCLKTIVLQNNEEALISRSTKKKKKNKKKNNSKSISAPSVMGDFHIHIAMQRVVLTKFFKPTHSPKTSK